eukprot:scaffold354_cov36-Phaeocystis_antarctica.AAC.1
MTNRCPTTADAQLGGLAYLYTTPRRSAAPRCRVERPRLSQVIAAEAPTPQSSIRGAEAPDATDRHGKASELLSAAQLR